MISVVTTKVEVLGLLPIAGRTAVVPTMGALHRGHAALIEGARDAVGSQGRVIVTVFVNPTQFGEGEDFERYPRTLESDLRMAESAGADVVWAPTTDEVYDTDGVAAAITVDPGPLGTQLEGASRPGHFAGVLTVVAKLLLVTRADVAYFGEKDYQQLTLIRAMATALDLPVEIVGLPTVRDDDGLALSSRNRYLSAEQRVLASRIPTAMESGTRAATHGAEAVIDAVTAALDDPGLDIDYIEIRDTDLSPAPPFGAARLLLAVRVGDTRLIDNVAITLGGAS